MTAQDNLALSYQSPKYPQAVAFDNGELGQHILKLLFYAEKN